MCTLAPRIVELARAAVGNGESIRFDGEFPFQVSRVIEAPDESFLIFGSWGREDGLGSGDLYISYKGKDGNWTKAKNMGKKINSTALDYCPGLSPNGEYFFFTSQRFAHAAEPEKKLKYSEILAIERSPQNGNGDIYRIKASILDSLRGE